MCSVVLSVSSKIELPLHLLQVLLAPVFCVKMSSPLERETLLVAKDYVGFCTGIRQDPPSESAKAMRQLAKQTERQHRSTFQTLVQNFLDNSEPDFLTSLKQTMAALAHDGQLNWGRVVALFAFAGMLASELSSRGVDVSNRRLAETIARYLSEEHGEWLLHNGGWVGFLSFFHMVRGADLGLFLRNAFFAVSVASIAGIAALLRPGRLPLGSLLRLFFA
ncbi:anti-apoptotic protein NR13-like isoform X1 [Scleropages formosus]|nr:anti-apoptotic protein NR13-like isoform X1 [Scleropages formosus]XP_029109400.1 anti-apoptotic protein NR13-like isoform X1 [Scleropages formosus]